MGTATLSGVPCVGGAWLRQVTLLQSGQGILTMFSAALQRRAQETLRREGVNVRLGVRVVAVTQDQARLVWHALLPLRADSIRAQKAAALVPPMQAVALGNRGPPFCGWRACSWTSSQHACMHAREGLAHAACRPACKVKPRESTILIVWRRWSWTAASASTTACACGPLATPRGRSCRRA